MLDALAHIYGGMAARYPGPFLFGVLLFAVVLLGPAMFKPSPQYPDREADLKTFVRRDHEAWRWTMEFCREHGNTQRMITVRVEGVTFYKFCNSAEPRGS